MIVIKIGGGQKINLNGIIADCKTLHEPFVVVHGGNFIFDSLLEKLNIPKKYLTSPDGQISRYTTQEILDVMCMSYAGLINKRIVTMFQQAGINAVGLSGVDGKLVEGKRHKAIMVIEGEKRKIVHDDMTGSVEKINVHLLKFLLKKGFIPVVTPPALSEEGELINVDGDKIATKIAEELKADLLVLLIEAPGLLQDVKSDTSLIKKIKKTDIELYLKYAQKRMKKKLITSKWALSHGVKKIIIADGRTQYPILDAVEKKKGTCIT